MPAHAQIHSSHFRLHDAAPAEAAGPQSDAAGPGSDSQVIDVREPRELGVWTERLGCSEESLRLAVAAVGPEIDEICNYLGTAPARPLKALAGKGTAH
jgi:hypothetical protein